MEYLIQGPPIIISDDDIDNIMVSALEGGITYWCDRAYPKDNDFKGVNWTSHSLSKGAVVCLHDTEENDALELTKEKFLEALTKWLASKEARKSGALEGNKLNTGQIDAWCADSIIQIAVFGEVIYS